MASPIADIPTRPVPPAGLTVWDPELACPGYTLYCHLHGAPYVYLINMQGEPVHTWDVGLTAHYAELLPNGNLLFMGYNLEGDVNQKGWIGARAVREFSWDGELVWEYYGPNVHHDFARLTNGNTLILCQEFIPKKIEKKVRGGLKGGDSNLKLIIGYIFKNLKFIVTGNENQTEKEDENQTEKEDENQTEKGRENYIWKFVREISKNFVTDNDLDLRKLFRNITDKVKWWVKAIEITRGMMGDFFIEVTQDGDIVWEWHSHEHLNLDEDVICSICPRQEWTHGNSCEPLPNGGILTTFRQTHTVYIIDRKTGDFRWKWGKDELGHPHDPTYLPNGNVLLFDNGMHINQIPRSRILEINPATDRIEWSYRGKRISEFFAPHISGAQRLWNGNTLICEGDRGRLFEITPKGDVVWEFYNPNYLPDGHTGKMVGFITHNWVFRARRYPPDYSAFKGKGLALYDGKIK